MEHVYAVETIIVKRENFGSHGAGLMFSTTRVQKQGYLDEFFATREEAEGFLREWLETHRGEARVATFRVQGPGYPVAQTDDSLAAGREWMSDLAGYTPDLSRYTQNKTTTTAA